MTEDKKKRPLYTCVEPVDVLLKHTDIEKTQDECSCSLVRSTVERGKKTALTILVYYISAKTEALPSQDIH